MKKNLMFVCALVMAFSCISCSKKADRSKFVLGLDDSFPPLGFRDENNEIVGYDIDLAREVAKRMGKELVCQPIDWATKEVELNNGNIDCIWNGFTITQERLDTMSFTEPYLSNAQVIVVKSESPRKTLADFAGAKIGVQAGSSAQDAIDSTPDFESSLGSIVEFKENVTALNDLEFGNIDGVVMDFVVAEYDIKSSGKDFRILGDALISEDYGIAFRKNDTELRDKVQKILMEMEKDGTVEEISTKWFGKNISTIR